MFLNLLLSNTLAPWVSTMLTILGAICLGLILICSIVIIILVMLMQSSTQGGSNAITGNYSSFYAENKGSTKEGRLKKLLIACAIIIAVCVVLYFILNKFYAV